MIVKEIETLIFNSKQVIIANKIDKEDVDNTKREFSAFPEMLFISAKEHIGIDELKKHLVHLFDTRTVNLTETIVTNARHAEALRHTNVSLMKVLDGLNNNISGDFLAMDIRQALHYLGTITGDISSDDLLGNIFGKFCIGK